MGRLILALVGIFLAIMLVFFVVAKIMALLWIAVIVLIGLGIVKLAFSAGRRSSRE